MHSGYFTVCIATPRLFKAGNVEVNAGGVRQSMYVVTINFRFISLSRDSRLTVNATKTQPWFALFVFNGVEECHEGVFV